MNARWLACLVVCACSDPAPADEPPVASAWFEFTLSEPDGDRSCRPAAPTPYDVGSEQHPLTQGKNEVICTIHSNEADSWFEGYLAGPEDNAGHVMLSIATENELSLRFFFEATGTLELDTALAADCAPLFTAIIGDAVSADFDCPLLTDTSDPMSGCGVRGTVNFENCAFE